MKNDLETVSGRRIKFTPERLEQIRNLVERGHSRQEIAEIIGATLGSLSVTCSRMGISLRKPRPNNGAGHRPPALPKPLAPRLATPSAKAVMAVTLEYRDFKHTFQLPVPFEQIGQLALDAQMHDRSLAEVIVAALPELLKQQE
jgi:hypothetical protein